MIGQENLERVLEFLGFDKVRKILKPGVHRFWSRSLVAEDMERTESTIRALLPGGFLVIPLKSPKWMEGRLFYNYVLVPGLRRDVRIILTINTLSVKGVYASERGLSLGGFGEGSRWYGGSVSDQLPTDSILSIPARSFDRIFSDNNLDVETIDSLLGIDDAGGKDGITWPMVIGALQAKGITPQEVARKFGISE